MQEWKISQEQIEKLMDESTYQTWHPENTSTTVVAMTLPNGFTLVESSSCINPKMYNEELGIQNCRHRLMDRLYALEGYRKKYLFNDYINESKKQKNKEANK